MKNFFDIQDNDDRDNWLKQFRELFKIPTSRPDITATYRTRIDEWGRMETWQQEELMDSYNQWLTEVAADATAYCNFLVTAEELRNLSEEDLDNLADFVHHHVPGDVITQRVYDAAGGKEPFEKGFAGLMRTLEEVRDRAKTLRRIDSIGQ